jgi:ABC-type branched-subunit amino acid transport system permease subunit
MIYGVILVAVIMFLPGGISGFLRKIVSRFERKAHGDR